MTWQELAAIINQMPAEHRQQQVRVLEPYDKGREGYFVTVDKAAADIFIDEAVQDSRFLKAGEPFLAV